MAHVVLADAAVAQDGIGERGQQRSVILGEHGPVHPLNQLHLCTRDGTEGTSPASTEGHTAPAKGAGRALSVYHFSDFLVATHT